MENQTKKCPSCSLNSLEFEGLGETVYDDFMDMTTVSFNSVKCPYCNWGWKNETKGIQV